MKKKITITAGHSNTDPGAVSGKRRESIIATDMRNMVKLYLEREGIEVRTDGDGSDNKPLNDAIKLIAGSDLAVEFHCNAAANDNATGVECLGQPKHKSICQKISKAIADQMGIKPRRDAGYAGENVGPRSRLGYVDKGGIIVELFFISNPGELATWDAKKWLVAKAVAGVIKDATA